MSESVALKSDPSVPIHQIRREHSSDADDSVHASDTAHVNINRFTVPRDPLSITIALLMALSILGNIALFFAYRYDAQERDLDRYDDTQRQEKVDKELSDLRAKIDIAHDLIQTYGLQKAITDKGK